MTIQGAYKQLLANLYELYSDREAVNIADWVIEHVTGQSKINRILYKDLPVSLEQQERLQNITLQLSAHKPVQYVLNEVWFAGMKLFVNEHVLIPRPETEELVDWIAHDLKKLSNEAQQEMSLLDVGTGSGCIPVSLKKLLPAIKVSALDISAQALAVARKNAKDQQTKIDFFEDDFLDRDTWNQFPEFEVIVSNPPYIKQQEASGMANNVLDFEPSIALFVADDDALIFYKAIALFAQHHLKENGSIYAEINEALGAEVIDIFASQGFKIIELRKDLQGKDRMVKAGW